MKILVASDLTARSDRALARGFMLARELKGELRVVHVVQADLPEEFREHATEWARSALQRETERLGEETGIKAAIDVFAGHPRSDIARLAATDAADLLVLGVHDQCAPGSKTFQETTAGNVLRSSLAPALLVRDEADMPYQRVVIGVDFSMFSRAAIRQALQIAPAADIHLVHAYHVPFQGFLGSESFREQFAYGQRLELDAFLKEEMEAVERRARELGCVPGSLQTTIQEGEPREVLRSSCKRVEADLLVIATHGRAGLSRVVWGSVAADLFNDPPCDVLVIRPF
ncbi:MAG: universal stress protein [Pseudomonadota bacterium]